MFQGPRPGVSRPKRVRQGPMGRAMLDLGNRYEKEGWDSKGKRFRFQNVVFVIGGFPGSRSVENCLCWSDGNTTRQEYAVF